MNLYINNDLNAVQKLCERERWHKKYAHRSLARARLVGGSWPRLRRLGGKILVGEEDGLHWATPMKSIISSLNQKVYRSCLFIGRLGEYSKIKRKPKKKRKKEIHKSRKANRQHGSKYLLV